MHNQAYLSLGTNLGDRLKNLEKACIELKQYVVIEKISGVYETEPLHYTEQDTFYNCGLQVSCNLEPLELLSKIKNIEDKIGRVRSIRYGPRVIDIDIIFWKKECVESFSIVSKNLVIPHPMWSDRLFVIRTMSELDIQKWMDSDLEKKNIDITKLNQIITYVCDLDI